MLLISKKATTSPRKRWGKRRQKRKRLKKLGRRANKRIKENTESKKYTKKEQEEGRAITKVTYSAKTVAYYFFSSL